MRKGDIVRFKKHYESGDVDTDWKNGLLIEYFTWEKIATILYEGALLRVAARDVQLAHRAEEKI